MESFGVVVKWLRSKTGKAKEPVGQRCKGCQAFIGGTTDEELFFSGGVFLAGAGWFCGGRCENDYRLRFRIQPARTPVQGTPEAGSNAPSRRPTPSEPVEEIPPERRPAAEELAAALRARRRRLNEGT